MAKPKVISLFKLDKYDNRFLDIPIMGKPVDIFLECITYDLKIPVNGKRERLLDIFEETILKMINLKKCTKDEISDILCLPKDLINFILIRLCENGYLKDMFTLTEKGQEIINLQESQKSEIEYIYGKIFMIKKTRKILPYIHIGEFVSEDVIENTFNDITVGYGSAGNLKKVYGKCIRNNDYDKIESILNQRIIKKTISIFNKLCTNKGKETIGFNQNYSIESSISEKIYFHLQAVVQEGNVDELLVSDGFVSNIDGVIEYIKENNNDLLNKIKSKAISMKVEIEEDKRYKLNKYSELVNEYNEILQYYYSIKENIDIELESGNSIDELKNQSEKNRQILINSYSLLEWAFYYYTIKNKLSDSMMNFIKNGNTYSNADIIEILADKLNIKDAKKCRKLFTHLEKGKIYSVYNFNKPNLYVCLPITILEADENDNGVIHKLIISNPNFLIFIYKLNELTSSLRHDSTKEVPNFDIVRNVFEKTMQIVMILLPDLEISKEKIVLKETANISNKRLMAQVSLEKEMGTIYYNILNDNLKNEWQKISPDKSEMQLPSPFEYIQILSRILEASLYENLLQNKNKKYSKKECLDIISEKYGMKLPKSLEKVNEGFFKKAINNEKSTLGAYTIAYLVSVEDDVFEKLKQEKFIELIDKICILRGHANNIGLAVDQNKLDNMRSCTMKNTKIIGGYYE